MSKLTLSPRFQMVLAILLLVVGIGSAVMSRTTPTASADCATLRCSNGDGCCGSVGSNFCLGPCISEGHRGLCYSLFTSCQGFPEHPCTGGGTCEGSLCAPPSYCF